MTQFAFYRSDVGGSIIIRERKDSGELSADTYAQIWLGEDFSGVSYRDMSKAGSGIIEVDDNGSGSIL